MILFFELLEILFQFPLAKFLVLEGALHLLGELIFDIATIWFYVFAELSALVVCKLPFLK